MFYVRQEVYKKIHHFRTNIYKLSCHYLILHYSSCGFILLSILRYLPPPLSSAFSLLFLWYYIPNLYFVPTFTICIYLYTLDNRRHTTAALLYGLLANKTLPHTISSGTAAPLPNFALLLLCLTLGKIKISLHCWTLLHSEVIPSWWHKKKN